MADGGLTWKRSRLNKYGITIRVFRKAEHLYFWGKGAVWVECLAASYGFLDFE